MWAGYWQHFCVCDNGQQCRFSHWHGFSRPGPNDGCPRRITGLKDDPRAMQLVTKRDMDDANAQAERAGIDIDDYDDFIHDLAQSIADGRRQDSVPDRETWWLVERKVQPPQYCEQKHSELPSLTADPWRAARFATEREAFDYRLRLTTLRDECKETEHVFINKIE